MGRPKLPKGVKRIKPYSPEWEKMANAEARNAVTIIACKQCGAPVIEGYCCTHCGSAEPR